MRIEELKERLQNIGIAVSEKTLRRWGAEGFIHDHLPTTKLPGIGRGHIEEWPKESFEEAAAFSAVFTAVSQNKRPYSPQKRLLRSRRLLTVCSNPQKSFLNRLRSSQSSRRHNSSSIHRH